MPKLTAIPIDWRVRFVLLSTAMALLEEVITTTMTNLAPVFGTTPEDAHGASLPEHYDFVKASLGFMILDQIF